MATIRGCAGKVYVGSGPTQVGEVTDISLDDEVEAEDVSVMGDCGHRVRCGQR